MSAAEAAAGGDAPMQGALEGFLRALRANEVKVSPAEAIDAHRAAALVGFSDREVLRDALCICLAKSGEEVVRFERCFDAYFARARPPRRETPPDDGDAARGLPPDAPELARQLLEGDEAALQAAIERAGAAVGAGEIRLASQRSLVSRRLMDAMGLRELEALIARLRSGGPEAQALAERLAGLRAELFARAGAHVERQVGIYAAETGRRMREAILARRTLTDVDPDEMRAMETVVRRMAKRLATKYTRRRHRAKKGRLDVRRTLRRSLGHGGIPFEIAWKSETVAKPKIAVLVDVSHSVASAAQFLLLFLYCLNEVVERLDAFAFSDRAVSVNDLLEDETVDDAIGLILERVGFRPTDYGRSLEAFFDVHGSKLDRKTTVIILGDGRTNYAEPRLDLMRAIAERARTVVWLNPEPETYWAQGDSKAADYARFCTVAKPCNSLGELERIIEDVLRSYITH